MLAIFEYWTWIIFCLILIISTLAWYLLGHATLEARPMKQLGLCALNVWAVVLGHSIYARPKLMPLRLFFLALALYGLNLTTIYSSKLIVIFTRPSYESQIDTIEEVLESQIPIGNVFTFIFVLIQYSHHFNQINLGIANRWAVREF